MGFMDWSDRFALGITMVDQQHRGLIDAMNAVHDRVVAGAPKSEVLRLVDELVRLTEKHFSDEEAHMARVGFSGLATHQIIHRKLIEKLGTHRATIASTGKPDDAFFHFLKHWLSSHICGVDTVYAALGEAPARAR
jgi:hemerythrin-like metal-binding protein